MNNNILHVKDFIKSANAVLITAGAGMGVDSGLPDFRGDDGFWNAYPKAKELGLSFEELANPKWFETDPTLAWAFYGHRLKLYRKTVPHEGFSMLLDLVRTKNDNYFVYTSNVDGQFQKAGFDKEKIVECHGSIHYFQCTNDCQKKIWKNENDVKIDFESFKALQIPKCWTCNETARPNILMFWDYNWNAKRTNAKQHHFNKWLNQLQRSKQSLAIIEIGAGTALPTIRNLGERVAKQYPFAKLVRINPRESEVDEKCGVSVACGAVEGLRMVL